MTDILAAQGEELDEFVLPEELSETEEETDFQSEGLAEKRKSLLSRISERFSLPRMKNKEEGDSNAEEEIPAPIETNAEEKPAPKKKAFQPKAAPKCSFCSKSVYKTEELLDSQDRVFHKSCLRCYVCKTSLGGKQPISDPEEKRLLPSQYRVESLDDDATRLYCASHGTINRKTVVKGTTGEEEKAKAESEASKILQDPSLSEKNQEIKKEMEVMIGDATPVCSRCGGPLESSQKVLVSGMEKYHEICPSADDDVKRSPRYFVKRVEERPVVSVQCDSLYVSNPVTFMFELVQSSKKQALLEKESRVLTLAFDPDVSARAGTIRKLAANHRTAMTEFQVSIRNFPGLSTVDPTGFNHVPEKNLVLQGMAIRNGKPLVLKLAKDGCLVGHRKNKVVFLMNLDVNTSTVTRTFRTTTSDPQFTVTGFNKAGKEDKATFLTDFDFQTFMWFQALESVIPSLAPLSVPAQNGAEDMGWDTFNIRLFKVVNHVLHQYLFTFAYNKRRLQVGTLDSAFLFLSEFPEPNAKELEKADPLAELKQDLREKKAHEEREQTGKDSPYQPTESEKSGKTHQLNPEEEKLRNGEGELRQSSPNKKHSTGKQTHTKKKSGKKSGSKCVIM